MYIKCILMENTIDDKIKKLNLEIKNINYQYDFEINSLQKLIDQYNKDIDMLKEKKTAANFFHLQQMKNLEDKNDELNRINIQFQNEIKRIKENYTDDNENFGKKMFYTDSHEE